MAQSNEEEEIKDDENTETLDFNKPTFKFEPKQHHEWRQQGPYLICKSCEIEHAVFIGMDRILVGLGPDGVPILKNR